MPASFTLKPTHKAVRGYQEHFNGLCGMPFELTCFNVLFPE
jgi:hypothetical protein